MKRFRIFLISCVFLLVAVSASFAQEAGSSLVNWGNLATNIQTDVTSAITSITPLLGLILGAFVAWRMFRKFVGRT